MGAGLVTEVPSVHTTVPGMLPPRATVELSKKEKMVEMAGVERARLGGGEEELTPWNSTAYRKVGTMGTERQEGHGTRAGCTHSFPQPGSSVPTPGAPMVKPFIRLLPCS